MDQLLPVLFSWLIALLTWAPLGLWLAEKLDFRLEDRPVHHFIVATLMGAAADAAILGIISLWFPITIHVSIAIWLSCIVLFRKHYAAALTAMLKKMKHWRWYGQLTFIVLAGATVLVSLHGSLHNDSGLYYIQFMKWINSYPVVPGLANLHDRLGFNSAWHLLSAAFNVNMFSGTGTNDLNALLFMLIGLGCVDSAMRLTKRSDLYDAIWALIPLPWFLLVRFLTSTSPDLPSAILPVVYFSLLFQERKMGLLPTATVLMVFAVTVKVLSVLHGVVLIPLLFRSIQHREWKTVGVAIGLALIFIAPWLIRNVIQTGYLIFPMESIDLFSFDWKVPNELAANTRKMISTHAKMGTYDLADYGRPMAEWLPFWFSVQSKSVLGIFAVVASASVVLFAVSLIRFGRTLNSRTDIEGLFLSLTVLISLALWWTSGPNPRFIYGIVFFFLVYVIARVVLKFQLGKWLRFAPVLAMVPMLLIARTALNEPCPKKPTEFATMQRVNGTVYYPTTTDKCWTHELPCANMDRSDLQFRGDGLEDGFVNTSLDK